MLHANRREYILLYVCVYTEAFLKKKKQTPAGAVGEAKGGDELSSVAREDRARLEAFLARPRPRPRSRRHWISWRFDASWSMVWTARSGWPLDDVFLFGGRRKRR